MYAIRIDAEIKKGYEVACSSASVYLNCFEVEECRVRQHPRNKQSKILIGRLKTRKPYHNDMKDKVRNYTIYILNRLLTRKQHYSLSYI